MALSGVSAEGDALRRHKERGVQCVDHSTGLFECLECGRRWYACFQNGGRLPRGYWKCPSGCNHDDLSRLNL